MKIPLHKVIIQGYLHELSETLAQKHSSGIKNVWTYQNLITATNPDKSKIRSEDNQRKKIGKKEPRLNEEMQLFKDLISQRKWFLQE